MNSKFFISMKSIKLLIIYSIEISCCTSKLIRNSPTSYCFLSNVKMNFTSNSNVKTYIKKSCYYQIAIFYIILHIDLSNHNDAVNT